MIQQSNDQAICPEFTTALELPSWLAFIGLLNPIGGGFVCHQLDGINLFGIKSRFASLIAYERTNLFKNLKSGGKSQSLPCVMKARVTRDLKRPPFNQALFTAKPVYKLPTASR